MRRLIAIAMLACALALATSSAFAVDPLPFKTNAERVRFQHLTRQLRCMVCQDESLLSSQATFAKQLRHKIFGMMQEGKNNAEIKQFLVARYSNFILYKPPLSASTVALWFGTPAIFLIGAGTVAVLLRRRTRPAAAIPDAPGDDW